MVLSMLSTIPTVKLQSGLPPPLSSSPTSTSDVSTDQQSTTTSAANNTSATTNLALKVSSDMSRRKQKNPKPIFNSNDEEEEDAEKHSNAITSSHEEHESNIKSIVKEEKETIGTEEANDQESLGIGVGEFVKVEVTEEGPDLSLPSSSPDDRSGKNSPMRPTVTFTPSPPTVSNAMSLPSLPQLTPIPSAARSAPASSSMKAFEELLVRNNMAQFGEVRVPNVPQSASGPLVLPLAYLFPTSSKSSGDEKFTTFKMFIPMNSALTLDQAPPPLTNPIFPLNVSIPRPPPDLQDMFPSPRLPPISSPPNLIQKGPASKKRSSVDEMDRKKQKETSTIPLDLSKESSSEEDPLQGKTNSVSPASSHKSNEGSNPDPQQQEIPMERAKHQLEIEAHLRFLKAKQLEFLKQQQQSQTGTDSRCEECNINFAKHQNYIAHKKYYCSGGAGGGNPKPKASSSSSAAHQSSSPVSNKNEKEIAKVVSPAMRNGSTATAAAKSERTRSHSTTPTPPSTPASALGLLGLTSSSNPQEAAKDMLLLKYQQELLLKSEALQGLGREGLMPPPPHPPPTVTSPPTTPSSNSNVSALSHFVCEGCGIKFKSVTNLQAHQARYCAGLRKPEELNAFEALLKRSSSQMAAQQQQQQGQFPLGMSAAEMMSFLNAKSLEQQAKAAAVAAAAIASSSNTSSLSPTPSSNNKDKSSPSSNSEDFCCILCGYKEQSVELLKDHINMHFIGHVKKSNDSDAAKGDAKELATSERRVSAGSSPTHSMTPPASSPKLRPEKRELPTDPISPLKKRLKMDAASFLGSIDASIKKEKEDEKDQASTKSASPVRRDSSTTPSPRLALGNLNQNNPDSSAAAAAANNPALAAKPADHIRCDSCDIGFAHLSNFLAHKKYYCRNMANNGKDEK